MSSAAPSIDLRPDHWAIVRGILRRHVPDRKVLAFGSRATWTAKDYSDLDLAIMGDKPLSLGATSALAEGFGESDLPFKVDVVDWAKIDEVFRNIIRRDGVAVQVPTGASKTTGRGRRSLATSRRSTMGGEWQEIPFSEVLAEPVRNGIYKRKEFHGRGFKIVNMGELFAYPRLGDVPMKRVELSETEKARFAVHAGDLLFARRSLVAEGAGKCSVVLDISEPTTFESSIIRARPNVAEADSLFLYYFFNSPQGLHALDSIRRQVAVAGITGGDLARLNVPKPPLSQQRAIAHILGTLDDKIEVSRRMNETLEEMARALFKSWFVDFDPVRAKMEGRETGLPDHLADLFPDQLVDSEMGEMPARWPVGTLGDIATSSRSGIDPAKTASAIPYIGLQHMPRRSVALMDWGRAGSVSSNKFAFKNGDILFGKLRPYFHKVGIAPVNGICSTDIVVLEARMPNWSAFVLVCVSSSRFVAYTSQTSTGTKMPRTSWRTMSRYELCQPTDAIATGFQQVVSPMLERIVANVHESRTLGVLRDALVPKLVSGELRVRDAERLVGAVG